MKLLVDSHVLIWAADDPQKLTAKAQSLIVDPSNERLLSAGAVWEVAIKFSLGKLPLSLPFRQWMDKVIADLVLDLLPISLDHAERQTSLPWHHRDPFDRLMASQALIEDIPLISDDEIFDQYGVNRIWN